MAVISMVAAIVGMILGTAGFVMSLLNYLRDRPIIRVSLNLEMVDITTSEPYGVITVTNQGRRPVFIGAVALLTPGASLEDGEHVLIIDSTQGNRLGEGDKPYKCLVPKSAFLKYGARWRELRAYAEDSTGKTYVSPQPNKKAPNPKWVSAISPSVFVTVTILLSLSVSGCKSQSSTNASEADKQFLLKVESTPPRPTAPPASFKVFHKSDTTYTLVVPEDATDEQVESLIWELRDAAHARTLDKLKISQKMVDERKPLVWFHIYRGSKCASEKYADGPPPCGGSYHAAADFTYGGYKNKDADSGVILHGEDHETQLWDPEAAYVAKGSGS